jgi:hypothetical protein
MVFVARRGIGLWRNNGARSDHPETDGPIH